MKKIFTFIIVSLAAFNFLQAQTQPLNYSFEDWESADAGEKPVNWEVSNVNMGYGITIVPVAKSTTDNQEGSAHAELTTKDFSGNKLPGIITLGRLAIENNTLSITGGMAYTDRPAQLKGYYKYSPAGTDTAIAAIWLLKGTNPDTVGVGALTFTTPVSDWTEFTVNIIYYNSQTPDTLNIVFSSSLQSGSENSKFEIDNISLVNAIGVNNIANNNNIEINPNPANTFFNLSYESTQNSEVLVHNTVGQVVLRKSFEPGLVNEQFDVSDFKQGIYFVEIKRNNKTEIKKLIIR